MNFNNHYSMVYQYFAHNVSAKAPYTRLEMNLSLKILDS